jgi:sterol desaturase/sphingolipid hydroxylase (fatty acid hydroxylase superfamily)
MGLEEIKSLFSFELWRIRQISVTNLTALFCYIIFFYVVPNSLFVLYPYLPYQNKHLVYALGTYLAHFFGYVLANLFYYTIYTRFPHKAQAWKIAPGPWPWESKEDFHILFMRTLKSAALINFIISPTTLLLFGSTVKFDTSFKAPVFWETLKMLGFFILVEDFTFYWTHRLLHHPWFYGRIHKQHHEYKTTISIAAEYAHPIEYLFGNSLPVALGPMLYGEERVHLIVWVTWVFYRTVNTAEGHSGLDTPWSPFKIIPFCSINAYHDFHHFRNLGNYGSFFMIWDAIFGTNTHFFKEFNKKKSREKSS